MGGLKCCTELSASLSHSKALQVWRPLKGPVKSSPLGVIDVSTVAKEDLISYPLHFKERTGYNYGVKFNPDHRYEPSQMTPLA